MADIDNATSDVTLYDELGNIVGVTLNTDTSLYELNVRDDRLSDSLYELNASPHFYQEREEYYTFAYVGTLGSKNETPIFYYQNPTGSGVDLEFYDFDLGTPANITFIFRLYFTPTITVNGTLQTPHNTSNGSTNASSINLYTLPTATAYGTLVETAVITIGTLRVPLEFGYALPPNTTALVTLEASSANNDYYITSKWAEDSD